MFNTCLRVLPEYRRSTFLAFLLSSPKKKESELTRIFEAFRIVGKKFGQNVSIMNTFPEASEDLGKLKDQAEPMSLAEVETQVKESLSPSEQAKIKRFVRVIGSASIKTVVEVELADNTRVVMFVQPPMAEQQVKTNIKLASDFINELKKEGVDVPTGMFDMLLEDLEGQILPELDFRNEAKAMKRAREILDSVQTDLADGDYRLKVPELIAGMPVKKNIMFVEMASGTPWNDASEAVKKTAGSSIVDRLLDAFYKRGWSDADRHTGNFFVDPKTKTVYMLDIAQTTEFLPLPGLLPDERYRFSQFARAVKNEDVRSILGFSKAMSVRGKDAADTANLREGIKHALLEKTTFARWVSVINVLADHGIKLHPKYTLFAMKFHMTLGGENYVDPDEFEKRVSARMENLLRNEKLPLMVIDEMRKRCFLDEIRKRLRSGE